jgi:hypothetical protein
MSRRGAVVPRSGRLRKLEQPVRRQLSPRALRPSGRSNRNLRAARRPERGIDRLQPVAAGHDEQRELPAQLRLVRGRYVRSPGVLSGGCERRVPGIT